jgi:4-hydroxyphenylpyruvate dioxygenase-like putative hemolysin
MLLRTIDQVCVVVNDIQKAVQQYWNIFGIGPFSIYTVAPPELTDTTVHGKPEYYSMKLAFAKVGTVMLELIQPLKGESVYKEFLVEKGEGIHHIATYEVDDLDSAIALLGKYGIGVLQSGRWQGASFAYMNTEKALGAIIELVKRTTGFPQPEATYP